MRLKTSPKKMTEEEATLFEQVDQSKLPKHVAIIMDGNGRWAAQRYLPRISGHQQGIRSVREIITFAREIGVKHLTLYAFSNENWSRPIKEVSRLMGLLESYLIKELDTMMSNGIRFRAIGQIDRLQNSVRELIHSIEEKTKQNDKMTLVLALSYGGRTEIIDAVKRVAEAVQDEQISLKDLDEDIFSSYLYTDDLPDPDLMIRTSGEVRISNFFLWQVAYTELYFTKTLWPDFRKRDFLLALLDYQSRERRFGLVPVKTALSDSNNKQEIER